MVFRGREKVQAKKGALGRSEGERMNVKTRWPNIYYRWCFQIAVNLEDVRALQNTLGLILQTKKKKKQRRVHAKSVMLQQKDPAEGL